MNGEKVRQFFETLDGVLQFANEVTKKSEDPPVRKTPERLTAEKLRELKQMTSWQLDAIFKHGKKPVIIDDTAEAIRELRQMSSWQLTAIFGDNEEE